MPITELNKIRFPFEVDERNPGNSEPIVPITLDGIVEKWNILHGFKPVPVWVYGTLRQGAWNNSVLGSSAEFICNAWLASDDWALTSTDPSVPFLVRNDDLPKGRVFGELWSVRYMDLCESVDRLEGCYKDRSSGLYQRYVGGVQIEDTNAYAIKRMLDDSIGWRGVGGIVDAVMYACPNYKNFDVHGNGRYRQLYFDWKNTRYYDFGLESN